MEKDFRVGNWLVRPQLSRIQFGTKQVGLELKSMRVLILLAKHPRDVLPKKQLMRVVWPDTYVTDAVLTHAISQLRKAFGDDPKEPKVIQTISRIGYRLIAPVSVNTPDALDDDDEESRYIGPIPHVSHQVAGEMEEASSNSAAFLRKPWKRVAVMVGALVVFASLIVWWKSDLYWTQEARPPSIVVLPFKNLGPDLGFEHFGDSLTDELILRLANISAVRVISYQSAMHYKNSPKRSSEIAEELGVEKILEVSVSKENNHLRVKARLIDGKTELYEWGASYDGNLEEILPLQAVIAQDIASALRVELIPQERAKIEIKPTENLEAHSFYMEGRYYRQQGTVEGRRKAVKKYQQAVEIDPSHALAHAELADSCALLIRKSGLKEEFDAIYEEALQTAIELDDTIPLVHVLKAYEAWEQDDLVAAEASFKRALELDPRDIAALTYYGGFLSLPPVGKLDEAFSYLIRAQKLDPISSVGILIEPYCYRGEFDKAMVLAFKALELDPHSPISFVQVGLTYHWLGEYEKAFPWLEKAHEIEPAHRAIDRYLCLNYLYQGQLDQARQIAQQMGNPSLLRRAALWEGDYEKAQDYYQQVLSEDPEDFDARLSLAHILWSEGNRTAAEELLSEPAEIWAQWVASGNQSFRPHEELALIHAIQGKREEACQWFQRAIDAGWREYRKVERDPLWESLREEPQFQQMMAEVQAKVDVMRKRVEAMEPELEPYLSH